MNQSSEAWTRTHDLALIFTALGYGTDKVLTDGEIKSIQDALSGWRPGDSEEDIQEIVMEAIAVIMEGDADEEVARSIRSLREVLTLEQRREALAQAVHIAEADGVLQDNERTLITVLAEIWDVEPTRDKLMEASSAAMEEEPLWSLLHDIALMYIVVAHGSDSVLSEMELGAMLMRLGAWQPDLDETEIRQVLGEALQFYASGPTQEDLNDSAIAIRDTLSRSQRLEIVADLTFISEADGPVSEHEGAMIELLAGIWSVEKSAARGDAGS
jgi:uncharacterized tellurite resistance protein B-like protein